MKGGAFVPPFLFEVISTSLNHQLVKTIAFIYRHTYYCYFAE